MLTTYPSTKSDPAHLASYSIKSGTLANKISLFLSASPNNAADTPIGLRIAATITSVSRTCLIMIL